MVDGEQAGSGLFKEGWTELGVRPSQECLLLLFQDLGSLEAVWPIWASPSCSCSLWLPTTSPLPPVSLWARCSSRGRRCLV